MKNEFFCDVFKEEPMLVYQQNIRDSGGLALNLINKVIDGKLVLTGYTLDTVHLEALTVSIRQT